MVLVLAVLLGDVNVVSSVAFVVFVVEVSTNVEDDDDEEPRALFLLSFTSFVLEW